MLLLLIIVGVALVVGGSLLGRMGDPPHPLQDAPFLQIEDLSRKRDNV